MQMAFFWLLALSVDLTHALLMLIWGLGLPLLVWHRFPRLSEAYVWFAVSFVGLSVASHFVLGECVLTTVARQLWNAAGGYRGEEPFVVICVNALAQIRPSARAAVLAWQVAIAAWALGLLWYLRKGGKRVRPASGAGTKRGAHPGSC